MEAVKKYWFWGIFISILSIFAMSHNANALEQIFNIDDYELAQFSTNPPLECYWNDDVHTTANSCFFNSSRHTLLTLESQYTYNFEQGDIIQFDVLIHNDSSTLTIGEQPYGTIMGNLIYEGHTLENRMQVLDVKPILFENQQQFLNYYLDLQARSAGTGQQIEGYPEITVGWRYYNIYRIYMRVAQKSTGFPIRVTSSVNQPLFTVPGLVSYGNATLPSVYLRMQNVQIWRRTESKENKEVEQKTQEAVDESQTAGGDSSTSAQTGTTGLLNAITGAVSVISSAQPTNCKINGNMGNLDIGQLDLCANPAPAFVQTIGSLILILMCVPLAISLFNRFIAIFRSFQS